MAEFRCWRANYPGESQNNACQITATFASEAAEKFMERADSGLEEVSELETVRVVNMATGELSSFEVSGEAVVEYTAYELDEDDD